MRWWWLITLCIMLTACGETHVGRATAVIATTAPPSAVTRTSDVAINRRATPPVGGTMAVTVYARRGTATFDVGLENISTEPQAYASFRFHLKTSDDRRYDAEPSAPTPALGGGTLAPGEKVRGWLAFPVPPDAVVTALLWDGDYGKNVTVPLT